MFGKEATEFSTVYFKFAVVGWDFYHYLPVGAVKFGGGSRIALGAVVRVKVISYRSVVAQDTTAHFTLNRQRNVKFRVQAEEATLESHSIP